MIDYPGTMPHAPYTFAPHTPVHSNNLTTPSLPACPHSIVLLFIQCLPCCCLVILCRVGWTFAFPRFVLWFALPASHCWFIPGCHRLPLHYIASVCGLLRTLTHTHTAATPGCVTLRLHIHFTYCAYHPTRTFLPPCTHTCITQRFLPTFALTFLVCPAVLGSATLPGGLITRYIAGMITTVLAATATVRIPALTV